VIQPGTTPPVSRLPSRGRRLLILGALIVVLGSFLAVPGVLRSVAPLIRDIRATKSHQVPSTFVQTLDDNQDYVVAFTRPRADRTPLFTVTDTRGTPISLDVIDNSQTITINDDIYHGVYKFRTRSGGEHHFDLTTSDPGRVLVIKSFGTFMRRIGWLLVALFGGAIVSTGLVLIIVGIVNRSRERKGDHVGQWA
jgi:hypothetical protein